MSKKSVRVQAPAPRSQVKLPLTAPTTPAIPNNAFPSAQSDTQINSNTPSVAIDDLCSKIQCAVKAHGLGHLTDEGSLYDLMCFEEERIALHERSLISLDAMLREQENIKLSRRQRYKIACILASSVLQLQSTPWLTEKMDKKNVFFYKKGLDVDIDHPYIRHTFTSTTRAYTALNTASAPSPSASRFAARNSLSSLGIVLLELCYGQVIEAQSLRKAYLGADGKPHASTDYMTARDWAEMVCEEDPALEDIIRCCVGCIFQEKADWRSKKFTQAVYFSVVEPLEKINSRWASI